jgi:glycosyltransferase involved in cell wall biosynthesis
MRCPTLSELPPASPGRIGWPWTEESPQLPDTMPDGSPWPLVSVVTPSYNQGQFIEQAIRSVLLQGYPNLEYVIMDGGSTDGTVEIIRKYEPWLAYWVSEADRGQAHAVNRGWQLAHGEVLGWLNSDDRYVSGALSRVARAFCGTPSTALIYGDCATISDRNERTGVKGMAAYSLESLLCGKNMGQPAVFVSLSAVARAGYLNEDLQYALDFEYFLRIWSEFPPEGFRYVGAVLAESREWSGTKSMSTAERFGAEYKQALDALFDRANLPERIRALRRAAYSRSVYLRQARLNYQAGHIRGAFSNFVKALLLEPEPSEKSRMLWQAGRALTRRLVSRPRPMGRAGE